MESQTALIIFVGQSALSRLKCLACRGKFSVGDRVVVSETRDGNDSIGIAYHEPCAPEIVVAQLYAQGHSQ